MALAPIAAGPTAPALHSPRPGPSGPGVQIGVALIDLSTGDFIAAEYRGGDGLQSLADEIGVLRPRELVVPADSSLVDDLGLHVPATVVDAWTFEREAARRT